MCVKLGRFVRGADSNCLNRPCEFDHAAEFANSQIQSVGRVFVSPQGTLFVVTQRLAAFAAVGLGMTVTDVLMALGATCDRDLQLTFVLAVGSGAIGALKQ